MNSTLTDFCFLKTSAYELTQILFLHIFTQIHPDVETADHLQKKVIAVQGLYPSTWLIVANIKVMMIFRCVLRNIALMKQIAP